MSDKDYHLGRERQELRAAEAAADEKTRRVHLDLASRHAARARPALVIPGLGLPN